MVYSEEYIVLSIQKGGHGLHNVMNFIYGDSGFRGEVMGFLKKLHATEQDAEDVFQDAILQMVINVQAGQYRSSSSLKTYLISIAKFIWFQKSKKENKISSATDVIPESGSLDQSPERMILYSETSDLLEEVLNELGQMCKDILSLWSLQFSMKEITEKLQHASEGFIRKKKHTCMKQLVSLINERPDIKDKLL